MKKLKLIGLFFILILLLLTLGSCGKERITKTKLKAVPTLCFHGLTGSYRDELPLVRQAKREGKSNCVIRVDVDNHGRVRLKGKIRAKDKNPIVMVNYEDNVQTNFRKNGFYATKVVKRLRKKYFFKKINMVGYSLGNISIIYYQILNGNKKEMPRLNKQVDIAGHFNGASFPELPASYRSPNDWRLNREGKPAEMNTTYREMLKAKPIYTQEKVQILNLMGNNGNGSDGVVRNSSSCSLRYLVDDKNYKQKIFTGRKISHGDLIKNPNLIRTAVCFLW